MFATIEEEVGEMKLLCVGDSLTYGYDVPVDESWIGRISRQTDIHIHNGGICGDTTKGMLYRLQHFPYDSYDAFFLMGGTNDILLDISLARIEQNMAAMMDMLIRFKRPVIIGLPLLTRPESASYGWQVAADVEKHNQSITKFRQWLKKEAGVRKYSVVDFYQAIQHGEKDRGFSLYADGVHPTAAGYGVIADAVLPVVKKIIAAIGV